jgi:hypothetical protein
MEELVLRANTRVNARDLKLRRYDIFPEGLEEGTSILSVESRAGCLQLIKLGI